MNMCNTLVLGLERAKLYSTAARVAQQVIFVPSGRMNVGRSFTACIQRPPILPASRERRLNYSRFAFTRRYATAQSATFLMLCLKEGLIPTPTGSRRLPLGNFCFWSQSSFIKHGLSPDYWSQQRDEHGRCFRHIRLHTDMTRVIFNRLERFANEFILGAQLQCA